MVYIAGVESGGSGEGQSFLCESMRYPFGPAVI